MGARSLARAEELAHAAVPSALATGGLQVELAPDSIEAIAEVREHPTVPDRMAPSCEDAERGAAYALERIVQTARALSERGARVTVQSLCQPSLDGAMTEIARAITRARR